MILDKIEVQKLYDKVAKFYDAALWVYRLAGVSRKRKKLVAALELKPGDTVVDLGCGTGANLPWLVNAVAKSGRVVCVDLSEAMLDRARAQAAKKKWNNVEFVQADLGNYTLPSDTSAALATFALEMVPEYDEIVRRVSGELPMDGRLGLLGLKRPETWPEWLITIGIWANKPFGVSREYEDFQPWRSADTHMRVSEFRELLFGAAYFCVASPSEKTTFVQPS